MPHPDDFSVAALDAVAAEVGRRLPRVLGRKILPTTVFTITSTLQVWTLRAERLEKNPTALDLAALADPAPRWQHQIAVDGEPKLYARSGPPSPGTAPEVHEIVVSPVLGRLDAAIDLADRDGDDAEVARLVEAPAFHVWALWLVVPEKRGRVVLVDAPPALQLARGELHPDRELVRELRRVGPVVGVRPG